MINILIAEDHKLVREGLRGILERDPAFVVVGEASNGLDAVEQVRRARPDILLLDLTLPRLHGFEVLTQLATQRKTKMIIVSMHSDHASVLEGLRLGANGFVFKDSPSAELIDAIKRVARGEVFLSPCLEALLRRQGLAKHNTSQSIEEGKPELTKREMIVLQKVASGASSEQVAQELSVSVCTISKHRASIMKKIGARGPMDLLRYALRNHLVQI